MKTLRRAISLTFASVFMLTNVSLAEPACTATTYCSNGTTVSCSGTNKCVASSTGVSCWDGDTISIGTCGGGGDI